MDIFNSNSEQLYFPKIDEVTHEVTYVKKEEHVFLKNFKKEYKFFLIAAVLFGVLYTFSMYRNYSGIASVLYPVCAIVYILISAKKVGAALKKEITFFAVSIIALSVNICLTKDSLVLFFDHTAIFLLIVAMSLHIYYDDSKWGLGKYIGQIIAAFFGQIEFVFSIIADSVTYKKEYSTKKSNPVVIYVIIGIIITLPLLLVVLLLLGSADYFFGEFLVRTIIEPLTDIRIDNIDIIIMFGMATIGAYSFIRKMSAHNLSEEVKPSPELPAAIAITINVILGFVYLVFSGFQIFTLFLGNGQLPQDYTYAEYAREGFFQLVVVCIINMILVLLSLYISKESKVLKICLMVISACTYLMIVSSTYRMYMYVNVYQLTYTRVFVFFALIVIFMAMIGITIYIFNSGFNLFEYCMVMVTLLYIFFAYANPEGLIAKNNLSEKFYRDDQCQSIDYNYLSRLSSNATPEMVKAFTREDDDYGFKHVIDNKKIMNEIIMNQTGFRQFNFSVYGEYQALKNIQK